MNQIMFLPLDVDCSSIFFSTNYRNSKVIL